MTGRVVSTTQPSTARGEGAEAPSPPPLTTGLASVHAVGTRAVGVLSGGRNASACSSADDEKKARC